MNWKKRKKRNKLMKHYGFYAYIQYEMLLRIKYQIQYYKERGWFSNEDRILLAQHDVYQTYLDRIFKKYNKRR